METTSQNIESVDSSLARTRLVADLKSLARDAEDLLKATAGDMSEKARDARSRLTVAVQRSRDTCEHLQEQTAARARAAARTTDIAVRSHPYESLAAALGIGLLVGLLLNATRR